MTNNEQTEPMLTTWGRLLTRIRLNGNEREMELADKLNKDFSNVIISPFTYEKKQTG